MHWTNFQKILFRFICCYLFFFIMSNQFVLSFAFEAMWQKLVPLFAASVLHLQEEISVFTNGSGDTTYNYVSILCYAIVSALITLIWSILDRNRPHYQTMMDWLIVLVRYYVIYQMVMYGLAKLFYMQFQPPRFGRLIQPYGDSSPMGLLWTFMGYSKGYTMFTGVGELVGGLLLLHRRTVTLGALVVFGVMANVMALNFFYDVPVKILSSHLVLMSLLLMSLDGKRLLNFFITNRSVQPAVMRPLSKNPNTEKAKNIIKWILVLGGIGFGLFSTFKMMKKWGPNAAKAPLYGLYEVASFNKNGLDVPPLSTDSTRWKRMAIERQGYATVQVMTDRSFYFTCEPDTSLKIMTLKLGRDSAIIADTLRYSYPDSLSLQLEGILNGDTLDIMLKSKKKEDFLLMNRKFRWVNEYPFNR